MDHYEDYEPEPIDISGIELDGELNELTEQLARNVHEIWAKYRKKEGWKFGDKKDAVLLRTPLLVPYEDLTESEREIDRENVVGTLKALYALGYRISKPSDEV